MVVEEEENSTHSLLLWAVVGWLAGCGLMLESQRTCCLHQTTHCLNWTTERQQISFSLLANCKRASESNGKPAQVTWRQLDNRAREHNRPSKSASQPLHYTCMLWFGLFVRRRRRRAKKFPELRICAAREKPKQTINKFISLSHSRVREFASSQARQFESSTCSRKLLKLRIPACSPASQPAS